MGNLILKIEPIIVSERCRTATKNGQTAMKLSPAPLQKHGCPDELSSAGAYGFAARYHVKQEAFEKCWAQSPLRAAARPNFAHCHSPGVATVASRLRIDVHDNDNDNA